MNEPNITILLHRDTADPFARIPKSLLDDQRLGWKAKGILSYLLGKPQGWKANVQDIVNHGTDKSESVRSGLKEIRDAGYAKLVRVVGPAGNVVEWVLRVSDMPVFIGSKPDTGNPEPGKASTWEAQKLGNADVNKKEGSKIEESKKAQGAVIPKKPELPPIPESLADPRFAAAWTEWIEYRRSKRKPVSVKAAEKQLKDCERWGVDAAIRSIETSIRCDWTGIFEQRGVNGTSVRIASNGGARSSVRDSQGHVAICL